MYNITHFGLFDNINMDYSESEKQYVRSSRRDSEISGDNTYAIHDFREDIRMREAMAVPNRIYSFPLT